MYLTGSRATRIYQELLAYIGYFGCILPVPIEEDEGFMKYEKHAF